MEILLNFLIHAFIAKALISQECEICIITQLFQITFKIK